MALKSDDIRGTSKAVRLEIEKVFKIEEFYRW